MDTDKVMEQMEKFDFSTPVQVEIIFEDSDDDSKDVKKIKQESDPNCSIENESKIKELAESNTANNITIKSEDKDEKKNETDDIIILDIIEPLSIENKNIVSSQNKMRERNIIVETKTRKRKTSNSDNFDSSKCQAKTNHDVRQETHGEYSTLTSSVNTTNQAQTDIPTKKRSQADVYISNLLTSLSENIINVLIAYEKYLVAKHNARPSELQNYYDTFIRIKFYYFNLSYCTVSNIILPQEQSSAFMNSFIEDTLKLGVTMNKRIEVKRHIIPLLRDMINWTKHKLGTKMASTSTFKTAESNPAPRDQVDSTKKLPTNITMNNNVHDNGIINNNIRITKQPNSCTPHAYKVPPQTINRSADASTEIFSSGPPGQQISITVSPSVLQAQATSAGHTSMNIKARGSDFNNQLNNNSNLQQNIPRIYSYHHECQTNKGLKDSLHTSVVNSQTLGKSLYNQFYNITNKQQEIPRAQSIQQNQLNKYLPHRKSDSNQLVYVPNTQEETPRMNTSHQLPYYHGQIGQKDTPCTLINSQMLGNSFHNQNLQQELSQINQFHKHHGQKETPTLSSLLNINSHIGQQVAGHQSSDIPKQTSFPPWQTRKGVVKPPNHTSRTDAGSSQIHLQINEQANTEAIRSVSTDSGFASPVHFNSFNDTTDKDTERNRMQPMQPPQPVIAHITSMNPAATLNSTGTCFVCGTSTKQMCIGCYSRYYCSLSCQQEDWRIHQNSCFYNY